VSHPVVVGDDRANGITDSKRLIILPNAQVISQGKSTKVFFSLLFTVKIQYVAPGSTIALDK
jgi:hypothetical protein